MTRQVPMDPRWWHLPCKLTPVPEQIVVVVVWEFARDVTTDRDGRHVARESTLDTDGSFELEE